MARAHAKHGPSALDSLTRCVRFKYKQRDDDSADEGTLLHNACESGDVAGLTESQKLDVMMARSYVDSLVADNPSEWLVMYEPKLHLKNLTFGHADFLAINLVKRLIIVADFKFTRVDSAHDFQARTYGAAFVEMLEQAGRSEKVLEILNAEEIVLGRLDPIALAELEQYQVSLHIVAPRLGKAPEGQNYAAFELLKSVRDEITALYERIEDPFVQPTTDEAVCANCERAARCPALNQIVAQASTSLLGLPVPSIFSPSNASVTVRDRAIAQVLRGVFDNWSEQVSKMNTEFVKAGGEIPGFRLQTRSNGVKIESWATQSAISALRELEYTDEEILGACTLSVSTLARNKAEVSGRTEGELKDDIKRALGGLAVESISSFLAKTKRTNNETMVKGLLT